jgi:hypothetical protein
MSSAAVKKDRILNVFGEKKVKEEEKTAPEEFDFSNLFMAEQNMVKSDIQTKI